MTIQPTRPPHDEDDHAFVELLDVLLDQGVVVQADVVVSVATVPLVGIRLEAAVAGLSKMLEYGYFEDWDEAKRRLEARQAEERRRGPGAYVADHRPKSLPRNPGEHDPRPGVGSDEPSIDDSLERDDQVGRDDQIGRNDSIGRDARIGRDDQDGEDGPGGTNAEE